MSVSNKYESIILFVGDLFFFILALFITLLVRYADFPSGNLFYNHLIPFSLLFVIWILVFFIAGLYDKHTTFFKSRLPDTIIHAQVINIIIAAVFFFFVPYFGIAPKTNLIIYLIVSSIFIIFWRLYLFPFFGAYRRERALLIGSGKELKELYDEVNHNSRYRLFFVEYVDIDEVGGGLSDRMFAILRDDRITTIVFDPGDERLRRIMPHLYKPLFSNTHFLNIHDVYEEIFERVPLSALHYEWFLENGPRNAPLSAFAKRLFDLIGGLILGLAVLVLWPLVYIGMRLEGDEGPVFIKQKRIGVQNSEMTVYKFRTMKRNDSASAQWIKEHPGQENKVTELGALLRKMSIDEFPQAISILKGDMSLIGPRSDIEGLGQRLNEEIPYYNVRYSVHPGITGWAQVKQRYAKGNISPQSISESKLRLAYDLYYIKHQTFLLDTSIALRTLKTLILRLIPHS